jgi:hypothetical protein
VIVAQIEGYVWMRRQRLVAAGVMVAQIEGYVWMRRQRLAAAGGGGGKARRQGGDYPDLRKNILDIYWNLFFLPEITNIWRA